MDLSVIAELVIAGLALGISVASYFHANGIETRVRSQADMRDTFDSWIVQPLEANLGVLAQSLGNLASAARRYAGDRPARTSAVKEIQNNEFLSAVDELDAFCGSKSDNVLRLVQAQIEVLTDRVLEKINDLDDDLTDAQIREWAGEIVRLKQNLLSKVHADVRAERLSL